MSIYWRMIPLTLGRHFQPESMTHAAQIFGKHPRHFARIQIERVCLFACRETIMKGLIVCSVHALCDISRLEREACNQACVRHGIPAILTDHDHAHLLAGSTMLDFLSGLPGCRRERRVLIESYLVILNDLIWTASLPAHQSVFSALLDPFGYARPRGFLADYPILTTNLVRSSALLTNSTKLGNLTVPSDPMLTECTASGLKASATSLGLAHQDVEVLVAHQRDFDGALSIGMHPRFVKEATIAVPDCTAIDEQHKHALDSDIVAAPMARRFASAAA